MYLKLELARTKNSWCKTLAVTSHGLKNVSIIIIDKIPKMELR